MMAGIVDELVSIVGDVEDNVARLNAWIMMIEDYGSPAIGLVSRTEAVDAQAIIIAATSL